jgi:hypothetical protein
MLVRLTVIHLLLVSLSLVLLNLNICPHLAILMSTFKRVGELNMTMISYHLSVIRSSLPVLDKRLTCGLGKLDNLQAHI